MSNFPEVNIDLAFGLNAEYPKGGEKNTTVVLLMPFLNLCLCVTAWIRTLSWMCMHAHVCVCMCVLCLYRSQTLYIGQATCSRATSVISGEVIDMEI